MAFVEPIIELPNDNDLCLIQCNLFPGVLLEGIYKNSSQKFNLTISGLKIKAYDVLEWEIII